MAQVVALLADRREEIKAVSRLYREMKLSVGEESAQKVLCEAIGAEALASGRKTAPAERSQACLSHFLSIFERRCRDGGIGEISHEIDGHRLTINIGRCDYYGLYHSSDLPVCIADALCCGRESPYARGYDGRLTLKIQETRCRHTGACHLVYLWDESFDQPERENPVTLRLRE